jgi:hypothetical protein
VKKTPRMVTPSMPAHTAVPCHCLLTPLAP